MSDKLESPLLALAARVEAANGPDRELDCLIQVAVTPDAKCMTHPGHGTVGSSFGVMRDIDFDVWRQHRSGVLGPFYYGEPPAYTASSDAAMSLISEADASTAIFWKVGNDGEGGDPSLFRATVLVCTIFASATYSAVADTPALALTAASLRAHAAGGE